MGKRCIICQGEAIYSIKDTSDYYCPECAQEQFSDISMLVKIEEKAKKLMQYIAGKESDELQEIDDNKTNNEVDLEEER